MAVEGGTSCRELSRPKGDPGGGRTAPGPCRRRSSPSGGAAGETASSGARALPAGRAFRRHRCRPRPAPRRPGEAPGRFPWGLRGPAGAAPPFPEAASGPREAPPSPARIGSPGEPRSPRWPMGGLGGGGHAFSTCRTLVTAGRGGGAWPGPYCSARDPGNCSARLPSGPARWEKPSACWPPSCLPGSWRARGPGRRRPWKLQGAASCPFQLRALGFPGGLPSKD